MKDDGVELFQRMKRLKQDIEVKKGERQQLQGQLKTLMGQLAEHGVTSLEDAEIKIAQEEKELETLAASIREQLDELTVLMEEGK